MSRVFTRLPSPALVVACLALLLALGGIGGAAVTQAPPKNSVGTPQIKNGAVTGDSVSTISRLAKILEITTTLVAI